MLLGRNGSGKSTTLDAIAGQSKITAGRIDIDGRGGLGLVPQKNVLWYVSCTSVSPIKRITAS